MRSPCTERNVLTVIMLLSCVFATVFQNVTTGENWVEGT